MPTYSVPETRRRSSGLTLLAQSSATDQGAFHKPARSIFSVRRTQALRNSSLGPFAMAVLTIPLPGGPPLPLAPPCNRQRFSFVAGDRRGFPSWSALRTDAPSEIARGCRA